MTSIRLPIREYQTRLDLAKNESALTGADDFYGRPLSEGGIVKPTSILEAIDPEDMPNLLEALEALSDLRAGDELTYELRFRHVDGRLIRSQYTFSLAEANPDGRARVVQSTVRWYD